MGIVLLNMGRLIRRLGDLLKSGDNALDAIGDARTSIRTLNQTERASMLARMKNSFDPADIDIYERILKGKEDLVEDLLKRADEAKVAGDIQTARKLVKNAQSSQKSLEQFTKYMSKQTDANDLKKLKQASKKVDDAAEAVEESASFCGKPGRMKYCVGAGVGAAVGGYYTLKAWNNLEDEQKQCLNVCFPDDWKTAKAQRRTPTYKTKNAVHPNDNSIRYEALYPDMKDIVCTPRNMAKAGKSNCDQFCKTKCDYDLDDLLKEAADNAGEDAGNIIEVFLNSVFGPNWKKWLIGIVMCIIMLVMIPLIIKLI